jgi:hypothetical protein
MSKRKNSASSDKRHVGSAATPVGLRRACIIGALRWNRADTFSVASNQTWNLEKLRSTPLHDTGGDRFCPRLRLWRVLVCSSRSACFSGLIWCQGSSLTLSFVLAVGVDVVVVAPTQILSRLQNTAPRPICYSLPRATDCFLSNCYYYRLEDPYFYPLRRIVRHFFYFLQLRLNQSRKPSLSFVRSSTPFRLTVTART